MTYEELRAKGTPGEWVVDEDRDNPFRLLTFGTKSETIGEVWNDASPGIDDADAALICHCVNQFPALLEALELAYSHIISHHNVLKTGIEWGQQCPVCVGDDGESPEIDTIANALAAAKEVQS